MQSSGIKEITHSEIINKETQHRIAILATKVQATDSQQIRTKVRKRKRKILTIQPTSHLRAGFATKKVTLRSNVVPGFDRINP